MYVDFLGFYQGILAFLKTTLRGEEGAVAVKGVGGRWPEPNGKCKDVISAKR